MLATGGIKKYQVSSFMNLQEAEDVQQGRPNTARVGCHHRLNSMNTMPS
jgi:hypothetical protein